jgi:hypothetical protein
MTKNRDLPLGVEGVGNVGPGVPGEGLAGKEKIAEKNKDDGKDHHVSP